MNTFFEKLTNFHGSSASTDQVDSKLNKPEPKKSKVRPAATLNNAAVLPKETHIKVDTEDRKESVSDDIVIPEEEGELTVDIYDRGDSIVIQSTVAGVKPEDLDISITEDMVTIRGKRERQEETKDDNYYYKELFWGNFARSIILPEEIDDDAAEASLKHGLLTIRLPKKKKGVVQKLKVKIT